MLEIDQFRQFNRPENYVVSMHGRRRMYERGIMLRDIIHAVDCGEIIEQYPEDHPFPSCLILGITISGQPVHLVVSLAEEHIYLITAYYPDDHEWEADKRTRREH